MDYYTLLTITYMIAEHDVHFRIWFTSEADCWRVLLESGLYEEVKGTSGYCDVSEVASRIVRPKLRPW